MEARLCEGGSLDGKSKVTSPLRLGDNFIMVSIKSMFSETLCLIWLITALLVACCRCSHCGCVCAVGGKEKMGRHSSREAGTGWATSSTISIVCRERDGNVMSQSLL